MAVNTRIEELRDKLAKGFELTPEEIAEILGEHDLIKEKLAKRNASGYWQKQKERMAADPVYAEKIKQQRKEMGERQRDKKKAEKALLDKYIKEFGPLD
jgi:hypothetical protein